MGRIVIEFAYLHGRAPRAAYISGGVGGEGIKPLLLPPEWTNVVFPTNFVFLYSESEKF